MARVGGGGEFFFVSLKHKQRRPSLGVGRVQFGVILSDIETDEKQDHLWTIEDDRSMTQVTRKKRCRNKKKVFTRGASNGKEGILPVKKGKLFVVGGKKGWEGVKQVNQTPSNRMKPAPTGGGGGGGSDGNHSTGVRGGRRGQRGGETRFGTRRLSPSKKNRLLGEGGKTPIGQDSKCLTKPSEKKRTQGEKRSGPGSGGTANEKQLGPGGLGYVVKTQVLEHRAPKGGRGLVSGPREKDPSMTKKQEKIEKKEKGG